MPDEDLQDVLKEDGATLSLVKIDVTAYNKKKKTNKKFLDFCETWSLAFREECRLWVFENIWG